MRTINRRILAALMALLLFALAACSFEGRKIEAAGGGELTVHFIDVGQADCALLMCGGESLLIDGGNSGDSSLVYSYLRDRGVTRLEHIIATHPHEDHVGGIPGALALVKEVGEVFSPVAEDDNYYFRRMVERLEEMGVSVTVPEAGDSFAFGGAEVTFLGPTETAEDMNQNSLMCRVDYGDVSFLFTGDAEKPEEQDVIDSGAELAATVLKVGHHGSNNASSYQFLREVMPVYAVISCEYNNQYGHPGDDCLSRLGDVGATVYRTDRNGDIVFSTDGTTLSVNVEKDPDSPGRSEEELPPEDGEPMYIGNVSSKKYHRPTCTNLPMEKNSINFYSLKEAVGSGFSPCGLCKP